MPDSESETSWHFDEWPRSLPAGCGRARFSAASAGKIWHYAPDFRTTIDVEGVGPLRIWFGRHRAFIHRDFLETHGTHLELFRRLIKPGDCVYDVGANIGYYARYIVRHCKPSALLAFEPASENLELLRANVALGKCEYCVKILPLGLGDVDSEETLQIDDVYGGTAQLDRLAPGEASLGRQAYGLPPKTEKISVRRLDSLVESGEPAPQFMKIDVEGAEGLVLQGAQNTLRQHAPRLMIALHGIDVGEQVVELLEAADYACYGCIEPAADNEKSSPTYQRVRPGDIRRLADMNIVASRDEADLTELG